MHVIQRFALDADADHRLAGDGLQYNIVLWWLTSQLLPLLLLLKSFRRLPSENWRVRVQKHAGHRVCHETTNLRRRCAAS